MSRLFKQGIACLVLLVSGQALATEAADPGFSLIPVPLMSLSGEEAFLPGERVVVDLGENETMRESVTWLAGLISEQTGHELLVSGPGEAGGGIRLALAGEKAMLEKFKAAGLMPPGQVAEAYSLSVAPDGVTISAAGEAGLFYGMVSLWQILSALPAESREWPGLEILDAPEFAWRGLMLDSARHMQSVEFISSSSIWTGCRCISSMFFIGT
jgi:hexosaminidase